MAEPVHRDPTSAGFGRSWQAVGSLIPNLFWERLIPGLKPVTCHFQWKALAITPRPDLYMPMVFGSKDIYSSNVQSVESEVMGSMQMCGLVYLENRRGGGVEVLHIHDSMTPFPSFFINLFYLVYFFIFMVQIRQQKESFGRHCSQFLANYIYVYSGYGPLKTGIKR